MFSMFKDYSAPVLLLECMLNSQWAWSQLSHILSWSHLSVVSIWSQLSPAQSKTVIMSNKMQALSWWNPKLPGTAIQWCYQVWLPANWNMVRFKCKFRTFPESLGKCDSSIWTEQIYWHCLPASHHSVSTMFRRWNLHTSCLLLLWYMWTCHRSASDL